jgi:nucleoside-diphosphate-sugar epimerase
MNCLVLGYGWLGKPLALELKKKGWNVFASTRSETKGIEIQKNGMHSWSYNSNAITHFPNWFSDLDVLIFNIPPSGISDYPDALHEIIKHLNKNCRVIFTSSTGVYLEKDGIVDEGSALIPDHPIVKAERTLQDSGNQFIILRLAGLIGGERHPVKYLSGRNLTNGNHAVNLVHRDDVIQVIFLLIKKREMNKIYNVCYPYHPTKSEYYSQRAIAMQLMPPYFDDGIGTGKIISSEKIEKELNFVFQKMI